MKRFIEGEDRSQSTLFPEHLDDYITEDNPGRNLKCSLSDCAREQNEISLDAVAPRMTPANLMRSGRRRKPASNVGQIFKAECLTNNDLLRRSASNRHACSQTTYKSLSVYSVQFSILRSWTRPNSPVLLVTSVSSRERACAAIKRSFAPIIVPRAFSAARIWA